MGNCKRVVGDETKMSHQQVTHNKFVQGHDDSFLQ